MNLRDLRQKRKIPQYVLAGEARVPLMTLYLIERRGRVPTVEEAERLAKVLGVDASEVEELKAARP